MTGHRLPSKRSRQVSDLIHRELALILKRETNDLRLNKLLITEVDAAPDLKSVRIFYTLLDPMDLIDTEKALTKGSGFLRQVLAERVTLRHIPKLIFVYDKNLAAAEHLSQLLHQIDTPSDLEPDTE